MAVVGAVVGLVVASGFEQTEMTGLCRFLSEAGHHVRIVSPKKQMVRSWDNVRWNGDLPVDVAAVDAVAADFAALVVPGGLISADTLRADQAVVALVGAVASLARPVAATGHAPWVLVEAGLVSGRRVTAHPAIRSDLVNAGGLWIDDGAVRDGGVITGRHTHDLPAFAALVLAAVG
ncbi:MAG: DJ-1/PfpI family protein [Magnetospirillum sp.]|nr:DJ-1/PfpI family protein [Magnetospirillum sp.]